MKFFLPASAAIFALLVHSLHTQDENNNNHFAVEKPIESLQVLALHKVCKYFAKKYQIPSNRLSDFNTYLERKIKNYLNSKKSPPENDYTTFQLLVERTASSDFKGVVHPTIDWQELELFKEQRGIVIANAGKALCAISMYEDYNSNKMKTRIKVYPLALFQEEPIPLTRLKPTFDIQLPLVTEWYHNNEHFITLHQRKNAIPRFFAQCLNLDTGTIFKTSTYPGDCQRPFIVDSRYLLLHTLDAIEGVYDVTTLKECKKDFSHILRHSHPLPTNSLKVFAYDYPPFESTIIDFPPKKLIYFKYIFSLFDEDTVEDKSLILLLANQSLYYFVNACGTLFYSVESDTAQKIIHWIKLYTGEKGKIVLTTNLNINDLGLTSTEWAIKKYFK